MRSTLATLTKQTKGSGAAADLYEAALDDIGRPGFSPKVFGEVKEGEQLEQILLQLFHHRRVVSPPPSSEPAKRLLGLTGVGGAIDRLGAGLDRVIVALSNLLQNIPHFVHPTALVFHLGVDRLNRRSRPGAAVGDDQQETLPAQAPHVEVVQKTFPSGLAFSRAPEKGQ